MKRMKDFIWANKILLVLLIMGGLALIFWIWGSSFDFVLNNIEPINTIRDEFYRNAEEKSDDMGIADYMANTMVPVECKLNDL